MPTESPSGRQAVGMVYDPTRQRVLLFGGFGGRYLDDTWEWNGTNWSRRLVDSHPLGREKPLVAYDTTRHALVAFGGWNNGLRMSDTWELSQHGTGWRQTISATAPPPNWGGSVVYDRDNQRMLLFGGAPAVGQVSDETWHLTNPNQASFQTIGVGCPGSAGTPTLSPRESDLPWIGEAFDFRLESLPNSIFDIPFAIRGNSMTSAGGLSLPFDLNPIGMPGCSLLVSLQQVTTLTNSNGSADWSLPIPDEPALLGVRFFQQAFVLDPGANALGAIMSDAGEARIGAR